MLNLEKNLSYLFVCLIPLIVGCNLEQFSLFCIILLSKRQIRNKQQLGIFWKEWITFVIYCLLLTGNQNKEVTVDCHYVYKRYTCFCQIWKQMRIVSSSVESGKNDTSWHIRGFPVAERPLTQTPQFYSVCYNQDEEQYAADEGVMDLNACTWLASLPAFKLLKIMQTHELTDWTCFRPHTCQPELRPDRARDLTFKQSNEHTFLCKCIYTHDKQITMWNNSLVLVKLAVTLQVAATLECRLIFVLLTELKVVGWNSCSRNHVTQLPDA